jgi:integrase
MSDTLPFVSIFGSAITRYLALKEALGRRYATERAILKLLDGCFADRLEDLDPESFARWCRSQNHLTSGVRRYRMHIVRNFCLYRRRTEPACYVPDVALFPPRHQAVAPYIFTAAEIGRLLRAADALESTPRLPLRRESFRLALVLFYTTGLRRGELLRLLLGDYTSEEGSLLIRESKFHKSRLLPLSPDGAHEVEAYLRARRSQGLPVSKDLPLLRSPYGDGKAYSENGLRTGINLLLTTVGIRTRAGRLPRVHDFRHTFAVHALMRWYRAGADVQAKLPFLATYMGHVSIVSTAYYLHFVDQLAGLASHRFAEQYAALVTPLGVTGGVS